MSTSRHGTQIDHATVIKKMFALETRKGFQDTAVSGGFERYFDGLTRQSNGGTSGDVRISRLASLFEGYGHLDPEARRERLQRARAILEASSTSDGPTPRTPAHTSKPATPKPATPAKRSVTRRTVRRVSISSLSEPVSILPGVGEGRTRQLAALGVATIRDLLYLLPRHHKDYSQVQKISSMLFHHECTILGEVLTVEEQRTRSGKPIVHVDIGDDTGRVRAIWFNPYIARQMTPGTPIAISGRVEQQRGMLCFRNPEWELVDAEMLHTGRLVPVYPLTRGLFQKQVRNLTRMVLDTSVQLLQEPLSEDTRQRQRLTSLPTAIADIHYPDSVDRLQAARNRLAFDEFLVLQLGLVRRKVEWQSAEGHAFNVQPAVLDQFFGGLPFSLTDAQRRSLDEIFRDMSRPRPMSRMLQGDVGSGKTVVAAAASIVAIADDHQVALLAPTEILAEQHFRNLSQLLDQLPETVRPTIALLTGKSTAAERQGIDVGLASGDIHLIVGTHAILEEHVEFKRLGLAIIDEQHRFGVGQRATLRDKGWNPDVLVMTATPIPRSLALVLHGDLDVSIIDELPPGRKPILTRRVETSHRRQVYQFLRNEIASGHQAFVIYPLVEESEAIDAKAATVEYERLSTEVFPELRLGLLHGRMKPREKDDVMQAFRNREIDILVSTSVVEVGIDIPNATVMVIEGAERFGLSQLHQFRGRVGRGADHSYCILIAEERGENSNKRLDAMVETQDGFRLSEIDLELRGPGEFFGTRQSGLPDLKLASLGDLNTLQKARDEAHRIFEDDPRLEKAQNQAIRATVERFWSGGAGDLS